MSAPSLVGRGEGCLLLVWGSSCAAIVHWQYACLVAPVSWRNFRHVPLDINWSNVNPVRLCGSASGTPVMRRAHAVCCLVRVSERINVRTSAYSIHLDGTKEHTRLQILTRDAHKRKFEPNSNLSGEPG